MTDPDSRPEPHGRYLLILSLTALGVVYGDIGTSPLYAMRECFNGPHGVPPTHDNVLGALSLIFWSLIFIISFKYLTYVMRADNRGEGGILALMSLIGPRSEAGKPGGWLPIAMALFGAALLYGDGVITPAISVLSAVEGLSVATPRLDPYVIPITIAILLGLFLVQRKGTAAVGAMFGPVVLLWFLTIGTLGLVSIVQHPRVLEALNPLYGARFFLHNGWHGFLALGAIFLVVTGGESLYLDMGHFGKRPIRAAWFAVVLPALLLNYFGQGALIITDPAMAEHPFFRLAPTWALFPLVGLATMATVIASQAVISGAFSITRQAVQLGYLPRVAIVHTSATEIGQIYVPMVNWSLLVIIIGLVLGFKSSSNLVAAYGIAVSLTMVLTTCLSFMVARRRWGWSLPAAGGLTAALLFVDLNFFSANFLKVAQGGWFPLLLGAVVFTMMSTWKRGRQLLFEKVRALSFPLELFLQDVANHPERRVPGTAVFMTSNADGTPPGLLHNLKHNKVVHKRVVLLTVTTEEVPYVSAHERVEVQELGQGFWRVILRYGFTENPDVASVLTTLKVPGLEFNMMDTSFYLSRESLFASQRPGMAVWRERLFIWMSRNALPATAFFDLPPNRVVELGAHIEL